MAWSLDWFAAEALAKAGAQIRRVAWTNKVLVYQGGFLTLLTNGVPSVVKATDFGAHEFNARDWTDQPFTANVCAAVPAFNTKAVSYGQWTDQPIQASPPPPGFPSP